MDQTCLGSLAAADDLAPLQGYDFAADGLTPPLGPGSARQLAYRYREMRARYLAGMHSWRSVMGVFHWGRACQECTFLPHTRHHMLACCWSIFW